MSNSEKHINYPFSNTIHKGFDGHHRNLLLKSKSFDLYQWLASKVACLPLATISDPEALDTKPLRNLI